MKIDGGATIWARQTIDSKIFYDKPDKWFKIWFYIVNTVNYKDNKRAKRGNCFLKYDWIMNATGANKNQVKHCVAFLKANSMLATRKATRGFNVEVVKYKDFQNLDNYKSHTERNTKATQKPHKSHTILKKVKKVKNDKKKTTTIQKKKIYFNFDKEIWQNIKDKDIISWNEAYPACDVKLEITQMKEWLLSNPSKRKANYRRFITNWLIRSQEKGGSKKVDKKPDERKIFNKALESLSIYYTRAKLSAWLDKLPEKYHKEFQKYPDFEEVEQEWKKQQLQSNY